MKKKIFALFLIVLVFVFFMAIDKASAAAQTSQLSTGKVSVEIKSVYEIRDATLYFDGEAPEDIPYYDEGSPVIFVYEYPFFRGEGNATKKMNAVYEAQIQAMNAERSIAGVKEFKREKAAYTEDDYFDALRTKDGNFFDITTCSVFEKNAFVSVIQSKGWMMGGVHDTVYDWHTFDLGTGNELEITDVFNGSKNEILNRLEKAFDAEGWELMEPGGEIKFCLTEQGLTCAPENIFGYQRGASIVIPYNDAMVKNPFGAAVSMTASVPQKPVTTGAISVSASQLIGDYEENEIAADLKYKGKRFAVEGNILNIGKGLFDIIYIELANELPLVFRTVDCKFDDLYAEQVAQLRKGQRIKIEGTCDGVGPMTVIMKNCVLK